MTPDDLATEAQRIFLESAKNHIPKRTKKKQKYISDNTLKLIEERREMKAKGKNFNTAMYKAKCKEIKRSVRQDKKNFLAQQCQEMEDLHKKNKDRQLFNQAKEMTREFQPSLKVMKNKNGEILTENIEILDRWKEYCSEMYSASHDPDTSNSQTEFDEEE